MTGEFHRTSGIEAYREKIRRRLENCPRPHAFVLHTPDRMCCTQCGGELDLHAASWYMQGLKDGQQTREGQEGEK